MPVFYTVYNWLFYCKSSGSLDCLPCRKTAVRVVYFTVSLSTLLTGKCIRNCLYLNWLSNLSLAKRYHWKGGLADSCRGFNLATPSSSVSYHECIQNRACQEGRKSGLSLIGFRKSICANPCIIAPMVRSRLRAPDGNQPILTKLCKYLPDFTQFVFSWFRLTRVYRISLI